MLNPTVLTVKNEICGFSLNPSEKTLKFLIISKENSLFSLK